MKLNEDLHFFASVVLEKDVLFCSVVRYKILSNSQYGTEVPN